MYCGNNRLHRNLTNGSVRLGTRYECLKKGIVTGLNMPYDDDYSYDYEPIDDTKIYCGNNDQLPENYDMFGNLPACLRKGIGIGKKQKVENENDDGGGDVYQKSENSYTVFFLIFFVLKITIALLLIYFKPKFIIKNQKTKQINYTKVVFISLISSLILVIIFFLFYKYNLKIHV